MKIFLSIFAIMLPGLLHAGDQFEVKNRSTFVFEEQARNPFLPIGWVKPKHALIEQAVAGAVLKPEDFLLSSILLGRVPLAVINGKAYTEGDVAPIAVGEKKVLVKVEEITDGEVVLSYLDRDIRIPLKRR
jgi:hypothetical protein